jgi:LysM repeat protein
MWRCPLSPLPLVNNVLLMQRYQLDRRFHCPVASVTNRESHVAPANWSVSSNGRSFCAESVADAYRNAGVPLVNGRSDSVSPNTIVKVTTTGGLNHAGESSGGHRRTIPIISPYHIAAVKRVLLTHFSRVNDGFPRPGLPALRKSWRSSRNCRIRPGTTVMAIERKPATPVPVNFQPPSSSPYRVKNGDSWGVVARRFGIGAWDLIRFNFKTSKPAEVNWYLKHYVGCNQHTTDGKNYIFSASADPGIIYVPAKTAVAPPSIPQEPRKWQEISFWFEGIHGSVSLYKILGYKKLRGHLGMRINKSPCDWYVWSLSASLGSAGPSVKGAPPLSVGSIKTTEKSFRFDPDLFNPRTDWNEPPIKVHMYGTTLTITVKNALPRIPSRTYQPIEGVTSRDLVISVTMDGPETGGAKGVGYLSSGRDVKCQAPKNPYGLPSDGWT